MQNEFETYIQNAGSLLWQSMSHSPTETEAIASQVYTNYLSKHSHVLILLYGNLGTGKTTFVRALAAKMGVKANVNSPSFNLLNSYTAKARKKGGRGSLHHYDLYRLRDAGELEELNFLENWGGVSQAHAPSSPDDFQVHAIEWPQIAYQWIPYQSMNYSLVIGYQDFSSTSRHFSLYAKEPE